jgi:hypothetical protein
MTLLASRIYCADDGMMRPNEAVGVLVPVMFCPPEIPYVPLEPGAAAFRSRGLTA